MKNLILITSLAISVVFAPLSFAKKNDVPLPYYNSAAFMPQWIKPGSNALDSFHQIPSFSFVNQNGESVTEENFNDKIYVASFFSSNCSGVCEKMKAHITKIQKKFAQDDDVLILSHSVMPTADSVEELSSYADQNDVMPGKWHLVTGAKQAIHDLAKNYYFADEDLGALSETEDLLQSDSLILIDQNRHIRGVYSAVNQSSLKYLIKDILTLKAAAR